MGGGLFYAILLIKSYKKFIILGQVSVFEADAYGLHDELFWFTLSKYCYILSLLFSKNKNFILYSLLIFITSIGYILVGLRGYTIAYGFLLLFFLDIRYRLKIKWLLLVAILVTTISSLILNYRIGIEVNSGLLGIIFNPLLQQGASFETVYGALKYNEKILSCISYYDYFFTNKDIGSCIDIARGVYFKEGGSFASSFYSELIYLGWIIGSVALLLFAFSLAFVQSCYEKIIKNSMNNKLAYTYRLIIFLALPNLIYFARSSLFDFITKVLFIALFIGGLSIVRHIALNIKKCH